MSDHFIEDLLRHTEKLPKTTRQQALANTFAVALEFMNDRQAIEARAELLRRMPPGGATTSTIDLLDSHLAGRLLGARRG